MAYSLAILCLATSFLLFAPRVNAGESNIDSIYAFNATDIDGNEVSVFVAICGVHF